MECKATYDLYEEKKQFLKKIDEICSETTDHDIAALAEQIRNHQFAADIIFRLLGENRQITIDEAEYRLITIWDAHDEHTKRVDADWTDEQIDEFVGEYWQTGYEDSPGKTTLDVHWRFAIDSYNCATHLVLVEVGEDEIEEEPEEEGEFNPFS